MFILFKRIKFINLKNLLPQNLNIQRLLSTRSAYGKILIEELLVTGLDPAGPLFNFLEPRLSFSDARFVDIIHTDYRFYGIAKATGTVDFFPNGGRRVQPGCPLNTTMKTKEGIFLY